jgi:hypothetical protein
MGWARQDFSLACLEAECNFSEGGLARLNGSGSRTIVYYCTTLLLNLRVLLLERGRSCCQAGETRTVTGVPTKVSTVNKKVSILFRKLGSLKNGPILF